MRTIAEGNARVIKLLGKQHHRDVQYRMMKYVLKADCTDGILLHNVITGQLILLDADEAALLEALPVSQNQVAEPLIEAYFLVPADYEEQETVDKLRILMKRIFDVKGINHYMILPTTNCNARCPYCFENGVRRISMDMSTADRIVEYICANRSKESINLHWFGGEPLLGVSKVDHICEGLKNHGISFRSVMTSNGYLFSEELINRVAVDWNLRLIQITLDGTEEIYNKVKGYVYTDKGEESPYWRVLRNIHLLLERGIQVIIRLNVDKQNAGDLRNLIDELFLGFYDTGKKPDIYAARIFDECEILSESAAAVEEIDGDLSRSLNELNDYLKQIGMYGPTKNLLSLKINSCMADSDETVVIFPDGCLSKCEMIKDEYIYGHISSDELFVRNREQFREVLQLKNCGDCPLYPACILLKNCPTKKDTQNKDCRCSVRFYEQELVDYYRKH